MSERIIAWLKAWRADRRGGPLSDAYRSGDRDIADRLERIETALAGIDKHIDNSRTGSQGEGNGPATH